MVKRIFHFYEIFKTSEIQFKAIFGHLLRKSFLHQPIKMLHSKIKLSPHLLTYLPIKNLPLYQFLPCASPNVEISLQNFFFVVLTLLPHCCKVSMPYLLPIYWSWTMEVVKKTETTLKGSWVSTISFFN